MPFFYLTTWSFDYFIIHVRSYVHTYMHAYSFFLIRQVHMNYTSYLFWVLFTRKKKKLKHFSIAFKLLFDIHNSILKKKNYDCYHVHIDVFISCFLVVETCMHMYVHTYLSYVLRMVNIWFYFQPFNYRSRQSTTFRYNK